MFGSHMGHLAASKLSAKPTSMRLMGHFWAPDQTVCVRGVSRSAPPRVRSPALAVMAKHTINEE